MTASGQPSASSDTIHLNKEQALKVLAQALRANVLEEEVSAYKSEIDSLNKIISIKISQIDLLSTQIDRYKALIETYKSELKALNEQKALYEKQVAALSKSLKKERRKKRWTTIAAVGGMAALATLYILK